MSFRTFRLSCKESLQKLPLGALRVLTALCWDVIAKGDVQAGAGKRFVEVVDSMLLLACSDSIMLLTQMELGLPARFSTVFKLLHLVKGKSLADAIPMLEIFQNESL